MPDVTRTQFPGPRPRNTLAPFTAGWSILDNISELWELFGQPEGMDNADVECMRLYLEFIGHEVGISPPAVLDMIQMNYPCTQKKMTLVLMLRRENIRRQAKEAESDA